MRSFARAVAAFLLLVSAVSLHAQSYTLGAPPLSACNASAPAASGNYAFNAGRWYSPQRLGPSWDFFFNDFGNLVAIWYGFNNQGHPVWYISEVKPLQTDSDGGQRWQSRLHRTSQVNGAPFLNEAVGELYVRIPANSPEKMVVSWNFLPNTNLNPTDVNDDKIDCIVRRVGEDTSSGNQRTVNTTYSGFWYPPSNSGWGYNALVVPPSTLNNNQWFEENTILVFDTVGQPAWGRVSRSTLSRPDGAMTVFSSSQPTVSYLTWKTATNVNGRVLNGPSTNITTPNLTFGRSYSSASSGNVYLTWSQMLTNPTNSSQRGINFNRGTPSTPFAVAKLTSTFGIVANPSPCQASAGQTTCQVEVDWEAVGAVLGRTGRPARRSVSVSPSGTVTSGNWTQLPTAEFQGSMMQSIPVGTRWQYGIVDFSVSPPYPLYFSSEVRALPADADIEIPDDPRSSTAAEYAQPSALVGDLAGATPMQADAEGAAASVNIPIQIPPGRRGMQPSVSLNYSSRAGNGIAGMGFSLSASSSISRCPQSLATDGQVNAVQFTNEDRLCLDGQRLIATVEGTYGLANAQYKTEIDSYVLVTQLGANLSDDGGIKGAVYFEVQTKSGERQYFGADQLGASIRNARVKPSGAMNGALNGATLSWLLDTRINRSGNYIQYGYTVFGSGENLLIAITYTGFGTDVGSRQVLFTYENRPDRSSSYLAGALNEQTQRLLNIQTKAPISDAPGTAAVVVRTITPSYSTSNYSGRSIMNSVQECFPGGQCMPAQKFSFASNRAPELNKKLSIGGVPIISEDPTATDYISSFSEIGDLDGDGSVEFGASVRRTNQSSYGTSYFFKSDANTRSFGMAQPAISLTGAAATHLQDTRGDFNRDGIADLLLVDSAGVLQVKFGKPDGTLEAQQPLILSPTAPTLPDARVSDVNGDGLSDLVLQYRLSNQTRLLVYVATSATSYTRVADQTVISDPNYQASIVQIADFDGDSALDIMLEDSIINLPPASFFPLAKTRVYFGALSGTSYTLATSSQDLNNLVPNFEASEKYAASFRRWGDLNGDGLLDLLTIPNSTRTWTIRLGLGRRTSLMGAPINTGSNRGTEQCRGGINAAPYCTPRMVERLSFTDYDSDGRMDLMAPRAFAARVCLWQHAEGMQFVEEGIKNRYLCPWDILTGADDIEANFTGQDPQRGGTEPRECLGLQHNLYGYCLRDIYGEKSDRAGFDPSSYYMDHIRFVQTGVSTFTVQVTNTSSIQNGAGDRGDSSDQDAFGDGLADRFSLFGYSYRAVPNVEPGCWDLCDDNHRLVTGLRALQLPRPSGATGPDPFPMTMPDGAGTIDTVLAQSGPFNYLSENRGAYVTGITPTTTGDPIQPDTLISVDNGNGMSYRWNYATLASNAGRTSGMPLYTVPARTPGGTSYADVNHFYFASSMPVVASFFQSNGTGSENETRFGYEEAMYNNKGRGFTGFRKIYTENVANKVRSATVYNQKFPLVSQPECSATQLISKPWTELTCTSTTALSLSNYTGYQCNGAVCDLLNPPLNSVFRITNIASATTVRDLTIPSQIVTSSSMDASYDTFGNMLSSTQTTTDKNSGGQTVRSITSTSTAVYANDAAQWWIDKQVRATSSVSQSYGKGNVGGSLTTPTRTTVMLMDYNSTNRQVQCEATIGLESGDPEPISTATCALPQVAVERKITRSFDNSYGNVTGESTTARDETEARSVSTSYSTSVGYFPNLVTDAFSKSISSRFDARFGVPISITDANGLISSTQLDVLGRVIKVTPPSKSGLKAGFPMVTAYERCGGTGGAFCSNADAKMRVISAQYGSPQAAVYLDSLGRSIRTASALLNSVPSYGTLSFSDTDKSVTETRYNPRGLVFTQYEPALAGPNSASLTEYTYDDLGRPLVKLQKFKNVSADDLNGVNAALQYRRTEYAYSGLSTTILVCQKAEAQALTGCVEGANNADLSPGLKMSRSFDSAGKLLTTVDALNKSTHYWFDGAGNPLQIVDVMGLSTTATYNSLGYRNTVTDPDRGTWKFFYNGYGELKTQCDARSSGTCSSSSTGQYVTKLSYDKLGRVIKREWQEPNRDNPAPGQSVDYTETVAFDNLGSTTYGNLLSTSRAGQRNSNQSIERWSSTPQYDALNRATSGSTSMQIGNAQPTALQSKTFFDRQFGRVKQVVYPDSVIDGEPVSTYMTYSASGIANREGFAQDYRAPTSSGAQESSAIRVLNAVEGRGLATSVLLGEVGTQTVVDYEKGAPVPPVLTAFTRDWMETNLYDSSGWLLARCVNQLGGCNSSMIPASASSDPLNEAFRYDVYGNLKKHVHGGVWTPTQVTAAGSQTHTYDALHRLTQTQRSGATSSAMINYAYNEIGGLKKKTDYSSVSDSAYQYNATTHQVSQVALNTGGMATYAYDNNGNVSSRTENSLTTTLQYDVSNLPRRISKNGLISDFYDAPGGRYWQRMSSNGQVVRDTILLDKMFEREVVGGAATVERYYIAGQLLTINRNEGRKLAYLHQDRLGSNVAISEKAILPSGNIGAATPIIVENRGFDAFGKALDGGWGTSNQGWLTWNGSGFNQGKRNQRGFTGHEHLDEFGLIHMNGRAYDYNLGRFYGVDPFIQFPSNSQSLNPYSYLMNNPLAGTDPTGYLMSEADGACLSGPKWVCAQAQGSAAYRSGYAYTSPAKALLGGASLATDQLRKSANGAQDQRLKSANGAQDGQDSTQTSKTDGSGKGASGIGGLSFRKAIAGERDRNSTSITASKNPTKKQTQAVDIVNALIDKYTGAIQAVGDEEFNEVIENVQIFVPKKAFERVKRTGSAITVADSFAEMLQARAGEKIDFLKGPTGRVMRVDLSITENSLNDFERLFTLLHEYAHGIKSKENYRLFELDNSNGKNFSSKTSKTEEFASRRAFQMIQAMGIKLGDAKKIRDVGYDNSVMNGLRNEAYDE